MSVVEIYNDLMNLVQNNDAFEYKDQRSIGGGLYRIFSYRMASYTDFCEPNAKETRGSMWEISEDGKMIRCAARTMNKFFNAYENPFTMFDKNMLSTEIEVAMDKRDGSIISTFRDNDGIIRCKSHTSLSSEHAINSNAIMRPGSSLYQYVEEAELQQYTVNLEYTSPEYRIVLPYQSEKLTVLNVRHRITGELLCGEKLRQKFPMLAMRSTNMINGQNIASNFPMRTTVLETVEAVKGMRDIEGFVAVLKDGTMFKIKTDWYCALHFNKDSINVDSRLYESVLQGASDDLRQMFSNDQYCLDKIKRMEDLVFSTYNSFEKFVNDFYNEFKHLERKEYALKVQKLLPKELNHQGYAFSLYNNKPFDLKENMIKYSKEVLKDF